MDPIKLLALGRALVADGHLTPEALQSRRPDVAADLEVFLQEEELARAAGTLSDVPDPIRIRVGELAALTRLRDGERVRAELLIRGIDREHATTIADRIRRNSLLTTLGPIQPVITNPDVARLVERTRAREVATLAGLESAAAGAVSDALGSINAAADQALSPLVESGTLTEEQAKRFGLTAAVYQLTDGDAAITTAIGTHAFASLGRPAADTRELASLSTADWKKFLADPSVTIRDGMTQSQFASALADRFGALHPHAAFAAQLPKIDRGAIVARLGELQPLFARSSRVVGARFEELDTLGFSTAQIATLQSSHGQLRRVANAYPGLQLEASLDDPALDAAKKAEIVARRVGLIKKVFRRLGDAEDAFRLDYTEGSADLAKLQLDDLGASVEEQQLVVNALKSHQRAFAVAGNTSGAQALLAANFASGVAIGRTSFADFRARTALDEATARALWEQGRRTLADVTLSAASVLDVLHGLFDDLRVGNTQPGVPEFLKKLAGFQDLFGSLSFCDCQHCQSILGPATYFVDLMTFVDENIRPQLGAPTGHPLDIKTRRPDLWTLPLTCDNTNERIPTLDIVNEILENSIAQRLGFSGSLGDRAAVAELVYRQTLAERVDSLRQPFHLPLVRIASYVGKLGKSRMEVAEAIGAPPGARTRAALGLSAREQQLVTQPNTDLGSLSNVFGIAFTMTGETVTPVDASVLADAMGLSREQLGELVSTAFVRASGATVTIKAEKLTPGSVQNDVERVHGLIANALDRLQRMLRLRSKLPWSFAELDLVLNALGDTALSGAGLGRIAALVGIQVRHAIRVDELSALAGPIPRTPPGKSLFDRLFNSPTFVAADGAYPQNTRRFVHPAFRSTSAAPPDPTLARLTSALGVDVDGLATLARSLAPRLARESAQGFDPAATDEEARHFVLSAPNLTLLYRHARLAQLLGVTLADLFDLLAHAGIDYIRGEANLHTLLELHEWWAQSKFSLDDLAVATGRTPRRPDRYPDPIAVAGAVVAAAGSALTFRDTVFAASLGTSEQASRDLVAANANLFEAAGEHRLRLRVGVDLATATVVVPPSATVPVPPAGARPVTESEVREVLRPFDPPEVLTRSLGALLRLTAEQVRRLAALVQRPLSSDELVRAVRGDAPVAPLQDVIAALVPAMVALRGDVWDAATLEFLRTQPALLSTEPLPGLVADPQHPRAPFFTISQLRALGELASLASRRPEADRGVTASDLQAVLTAFDATIPGFSPAVDQPISRVLGVGPGLIVGLRGRVTLPAVAVPALAALSRAASLARDLGVDGEALAAITSDDFASLQRAADALLAALGRRHTDQATRVKLVGEAEESVRARKRDALVDHLIHSLRPKIFRTLNDLYRHFLMDVAIDGCATTSRVVAAIGSVQQYVQRVLLNLEQDELPPSNPAHVALRVPPDAAAEWSWRKNYRVWEANRKVFLWPENYIEPDLRDDKTPLFKELEDELLQTDITDQNVLDAYAKYLKDFEEVASLTVAGAYHAVNPQGGWTDDVLHLFGVSSDDPPTFYYRTCEHAIGSGRDPNLAALWTAWRKLNLQITGRTVSPVVHRGRLHVFWTDVKTRPVNRVESGGSEFAGYQHKMSMRFTTLRLDGTWAAPQPVKLPVDYFWPGPGEILDPLTNRKPQFDTREHIQAIDEYSLSGPTWEGVWLEPRGDTLYVTYRNLFQFGVLDLFGKRQDKAFNPVWPSPRPQLLCAQQTSPTVKTLQYGTPVLWWGNLNAGPNAAIDEARLDVMAMDGAFAKPWIQDGLYKGAIATLPANVHLLAVPGSVEDGIVQVGTDVLLLQGSVTDDSGYVLRRIGTTLAENVSRQLFTDGLEGLLDIRSQLALAEADLPIGLLGSRIRSRANVGQLDFTGPYGVYYREIFFHIPFTIANALNSRGRFAAAQRWYHYLFDPTASEVIPIPPGTPDAEVPHRLLDRVWRYREFRNLDLVRLRDVLTDDTAIALYKKDPFNPHAIARRRLSAYQKSVVMKYVDNLLDWGDFLFTQFTMESVTEASMLYVMAADVLGARPRPLGSCGEGGVEPRTYEQIDAVVDGGAEFLIELESWILGSRWDRRRIPSLPRPRFVFDPPRVRHAMMRHPIARVRPLDGVFLDATRGTVPQADASFRGLDWTRTRTQSWAPARGAARITDAIGELTPTLEPADPRTFPPGPAIFSWTVIRQLTPVFCVPVNRRLLGYWDRVEDRQFKIRHCMDITGTKRELALFAPEIEPGLLVRMQAAGLTLEDVLSASGGELPPYRFLYLVDRAKAFASAVSGFGASLLSAIEKNDAEELARLRIVQTQNLSRMTMQLRRWDIETAESALASLNRQRAAAEYRRDHFDALISENRNRWEEAESTARHAASAIYLTQSVIDTYAAITKLVPQTGSPFAMKYGGVEIGGSLAGFGTAINAIALGLEALAASTALEAGFGRRSEGWEHQRKLAEHDLTILDREIKAAEIRRDIAMRSLELHETGLEQLDEMLELTDGKFSNLGLYTFLSTNLQRLYREAYQNAMRLAKLAEQAFRFERGEEGAPGLATSYWDATRAGLLAGERLLLDLQSLERRFLETNYRTLEIDQTFALSQIDPQAVLQLRETGECEFEVREVFFDLFYPGHYKREIKSARLTIPSITGPFANVSATLTLLRSWLRPTPAAGAPLAEVPPRRSVSIATSTAQNDAGVFELSFRDERYMPFEGGGAISRWQLRLPRAFRQFDYQTINDVVLSISYTAEQDGLLRERVEEQNAALEGSLRNFFANESLTRVLSLRQDFSSAFTRLLRSAAGTPVPLEVTPRHFPLFAKGRTVQVRRGVLLLRTFTGAVPAGLQLTIDGASVSAFRMQPALAGLPGRDLPAAFTNNLVGRHTFTVVAAGDLAPGEVPPGETLAVDPDRLLDVFVFLEYRLV